MRHSLPALVLCLVATVARADVTQTVQTHILPGYARFETDAAALAAKATETCDAAALRPAYHATYDAWMGVQHLRFGPVETDGRVLSILFWPDPKASGAKAQMALLTGDPANLVPEVFVEQSVAARGLLALERLLYPAAALPADPCPLIRATTADLARTAAFVHDDWQEGFAQTLTTAGQQGNTVFLSDSEVLQVLFTQLATGLEFLQDQRLGRPLGTFDTPKPERAEARASERSARNVLLALQAMRTMAASLNPDAVQTFAAFDVAIKLATEIDDPAFANVATPTGRLKVEILQQAVARVRQVILTDLAPALGVGIGFNAADGD
ncbi:MAG: imelysin family protein [Paracoccaceae bacterium]